VADAAAGTDPAKPCLHENFTAQVDVGRIQTDEAADGMPKAFLAEIEINCQACGVPFHFLGLPIGLSYTEPRVSVDGAELRAPIIPAGADPAALAGMPGFSLRVYGHQDGA
jgi:hypothetical protein